MKRKSVRFNKKIIVSLIVTSVVIFLLSTEKGKNFKNDIIEQLKNLKENYPELYLEAKEKILNSLKCENEELLNKSILIFDDVEASEITKELLDLD